MTQPTVRPWGASEGPGVARVLEDSFGRYPVMRYVLGDTPEYEAHIRRLMQYYVDLRRLKDEPVLVCGPRDAPTGVALIARPGLEVDGVESLKDELWADLGEGARDRYADFSQSVAPHGVEDPHLYLSMIGVLGSHRGEGLGRILLDAVHQLSAADPESRGVALSTEVEGNVELYRHFGYELCGQATFGDEEPTWSLYRPDPA